MQWESGKPAFGFPPFPLLVVAVGMWESRRAIPKGGGKRWETCFWFSSLSTDRHFHGLFQALRFCWNPANNFCFARCIFLAASVSLSLLAWLSSPASVTSYFR